MIKNILAIFIAFLYSIVYVIVGPIIKTQSLNLGISQVLQFVLCFGLCSVINIFLFSFIPKWRFHMELKRISDYLDKLGDRKLFFVVWGFIFASWIPAYLILYPGVLSYDMISQVGSALGEITNNHHPILHTWLIRVSMKTGHKLFGSYEFGIGLLSLFQMIILSYALARLVLLLKKKGVPLLLVIITALLSAIWFMNACLSVTMVKDTLHAAFLVLFGCHFAEIVTSPLEYSRHKLNLVLLPIVAFFMCAFRNNGYHIYLFCFAGLLILRLTQIKKAKVYIPLIVSIILPVFLFKIYTGPVFEALHVEHGEVREALCIPIQQLQRVNKADELTSEQMEKMDYYIDNLEWREGSTGRLYDPYFADPAKSCFYSSSYNADPVAFWKFYLQIGKQFTTEYVKAFLCNTLGYWYPGYYEFSYVMYENYEPEVFPVPLERQSIAGLEVLKKYYESVCSSDFWRETPGLRIFFVSGFVPWILIYAMILAWRKRGFFTNVLPMFLPLIAQFGIMMLSPMSSFRYSWPFYLILPLVFIGWFGNEEPENMKDNCI